MVQKKTRTGPPSLGLGSAFSVQLYAEDLAIVERLALTDRTSKGSVLRNIISKALTKYKKDGK